MGSGSMFKDKYKDQIKNQATYTMTDDGSYCPGASDLTTEAQCQSGAAALGLTYAHSWNGPHDHRYCVIAHDGRDQVYFNTAGTAASPTPPNHRYASICQAQYSVSMGVSTCSAGYRPVTGDQ